MMVSGKGTPPRMADDDDDDDYVIDEDDVDEVIELDEGHDAEEDDDDDIGEVMDDDESAPTLFGPPAVDDALLVFDRHSSSSSTSSSSLNSVFSVGLDPSGSLAVSGGEDDKAFVWKVADGSVLFECTGHQDSVVCVAFNHDGSMVATGDMAGMIKVWKVSTGREVWSFECADLEWLFWHPVAQVIIAGTIDGSSWMWKIPSGDCKTYSGPNCPSSVGRLHPDGKRVCVAYGDGSLRIWDLKSASVTHTIGDLHSDSVTCMDVHREGSVLLTGGVDAQARLVNPNSGKIVATLPLGAATSSAAAAGSSASSSSESEAESVEAVALAPSLPVAAAGCLSGRLLIWDLNSEKLRHDPIQLDGGVTRLAWTGGGGGGAGGDLLFCSSLDGTASVWDGRTGSLVRRWTGHRGQILDMAVAPMGNFVLTASGDGTVRTFKTLSD